MRYKVYTFKTFTDFNFKENGAYIFGTGLKTEACKVGAERCPLKGFWGVFDTAEQEWV